MIAPRLLTAMTPSSVRKRSKARQKRILSAKKATPRAADIENVCANLSLIDLCSPPTPKLRLRPHDDALVDLVTPDCAALASPAPATPATPATVARTPVAEDSVDSAFGGSVLLTPKAEAASPGGPPPPEDWDELCAPDIAEDWAAASAEVPFPLDGTPVSAVGEATEGSSAVAGEGTPSPAARVTRRGRPMRAARLVSARKQRALKAALGSPSEGEEGDSESEWEGADSEESAAADAEESDSEPEYCQPADIAEEDCAAAEDAEHLRAFRRSRQREARALYAEFNQAAFGGLLPEDLEIEWSSRLRRTAGVTHTRRRGEERTARVVLSEKVVDRRSRLRQTLLHELCHVAAFLLLGKVQPPHGDHFWSYARAARDAYPDIPVTTCHTYEIRYKFTYRCQGCGATFGRHSRSIDTGRQVCGRCRGRLELEPSGAQRPPNRWQAFVKDNFADAQRRMGSRTPTKEVMKEVSRMWKARGREEP